MSTAGKVLTVLSALMMVVWIVMISAVTQLNMDASKRVDELKKKVIDLQAEVAKTTEDALDFGVKVDEEQTGKERELRLVRIGLTAVERQLTETRETLSRVQFQVDNYAKALATAKEDLTLREQEKADLEKSKADGEALVTRLKGEIAERLDGLTKLRGEFRQLREKNVGAVDSLRKGGKSAARPVSLSR